jgi:RimJ/RimL family protein N-acetyltransferase
MRKISHDAIIVSERLELREPSLDDAATMFEYLSPEVTRSLHFFSPQSVDEQRKSVRNIRMQNRKGQAFTAGMYDRTTGKYLGGCGVVAYDEESGSAEIGYWLAMEHQGKGYVTEAVRALCRYLFEECDANRAVICNDVRNAASRSVAERVGFRLDGILRSHTPLKGDLVDTAFYTLFPGELA